MHEMKDLKTFIDDVVTDISSSIFGWQYRRNLTDDIMAKILGITEEEYSHLLDWDTYIDEMPLSKLLEIIYTLHGDMKVKIPYKVKERKIYPKILNERRDEND